MMKKYLFYIGMMLTSFVYGQDDYMSEMMVEKEFIIIISTTDYGAALERAEDASQKLKLDLDLRGLEEDEQYGLSWPEEECQDEWGSDHCYIARGRWDDGSYVSIEYSDAFDGFTPGYYIVIVGSGEPRSRELWKTLRKTKTYYRDAYSKRTDVYIGCMH